ncbi:MAG: hypothetical protein U5L00_11040 [Desulfovermiculus sp.]|nr:hypothetical protein [Desulfovermiculus sp.]
MISDTYRGQTPKPCKAVGVDHIIDSIVSRVGSLEKALLIDNYARGLDTGIIDLLLIGDIDQSALTSLVAKAEKHIDRKIRTMCLTQDEYTQPDPSWTPARSCSCSQQQTARGRW